jgi:hypothetical protein
MTPENHDSSGTEDSGKPGGGLANTREGLMGLLRMALRNIRDFVVELPDKIDAAQQNECICGSITAINGCPWCNAMESLYREIEKVEQAASIVLEMKSSDAASVSPPTPSPSLPTVPDAEEEKDYVPWDKATQVDLTSDLNACHEFAAIFNDEQRANFALRLFRMCNYVWQEAVNATAEQRCHAFVATMENLHRSENGGKQSSSLLTKTEDTENENTRRFRK